MTTQTRTHIPDWLHQLYLYAVSAIMLVIFVIGTITLLNMAIRELVFGVQGSWYRNAEELCINENFNPDNKINKSMYSSMEACITAKRIQIAEEIRYERARDISSALGMMIVSFPIYLYHWRIIKKRNNSK